MGVISFRLVGRVLGSLLASPHVAVSSSHPVQSLDSGVRQQGPRLVPALLLICKGRAVQL